ncbi:MAG: four helix bundle protein [Thermomicrobiales bacterium]
MRAQANEKTEGVARPISRHQDLHVYQYAFDAAFAIFELTKRFPREEQYSLTDQVRRSSRSVCANIVEAWRKRRYPAAFVSKLADADAEAGETTFWLDMSLRCGYLDPVTHSQLSDRYDHICAQLIRMINSPEKWCIPNASTRQPPR